MSVRLGEVLVRRGVLSEDQVIEILEKQKRSHRPLGVIAERDYGVDGATIERAWAEQYASITGEFDLDSNTPEPEVLWTVSRRQAWQFLVLPVRFEGPELVLATTRENLPRALRFATRVLSRPCYFVLTPSSRLGEALSRCYPMAGFNAASVPGPDAAAA